MDITIDIVSAALGALVVITVVASRSRVRLEQRWRAHKGPSRAESPTVPVVQGFVRNAARPVPCAICGRDRANYYQRSDGNVCSNCADGGL